MKCGRAVVVAGVVVVVTVGVCEALLRPVKGRGICGSLKRCDALNGVSGGAAWCWVGEGGDVLLLFKRGADSKRISSSSSSSPPSSSSSSSEANVASRSTVCTTLNASSSAPRDGLDRASSILSTLSNFLAFGRGVYSALEAGSSTRSGARGVTPETPGTTNSLACCRCVDTTNRFAGVIFLNCSSSLGAGPGFVCALIAWRRFDFGLGLSVWVGVAGAMKR